MPLIYQYISYQKLIAFVINFPTSWNVRYRKSRLISMRTRSGEGVACFWRIFFPEHFLSRKYVFPGHLFAEFLFFPGDKLISMRFHFSVIWNQNFKRVYLKTTFFILVDRFDRNLPDRLACSRSNFAQNFCRYGTT